MDQKESIHLLLKFINKKGKKGKNPLQQKSFGTILGEKKKCAKRKKKIKVLRIFKRNPKEKKKKKIENDRWIKIPNSFIC